jgi:hypothetical protein
MKTFSGVQKLSGAVFWALIREDAKKPDLLCIT